MTIEEYKEMPFAMLERELDVLSEKILDLTKERILLLQAISEKKQK